MPDSPDHAPGAYERRRLLEAESRARAYNLRLQALATALSGAATPAEVYGAVVDYGVGGMGEATGEQLLPVHSSTLYVLADDCLELVHGAGFEPSLIAHYQRIPLAAPVPAADAVRSGQAIWIRSKAAFLQRYPHLAEHIQLLSGEAVLSLPLMVEQRALGVLNLTFSQPLAFDADERGFLLSLAALCAQALERSRLYDAEQRRSRDQERALARLKQLLEITDRLNGLGDAVEMARVLVEGRFDVYGPVAGGVALLREDGRLAHVSLYG